VNRGVTIDSIWFDCNVIDKSLLLTGDSVRLEPLGQKHAAALRERCSDERLWQYTYQLNPFLTAETTERCISDAVEDPHSVAFAILDAASGELAGSTRYLDIDEKNRKLEIGWTFLAPQYWRTRVNTETKYLLFRYAFEEWGALRVQLKAEAVNTRSRDAIARIGATYEGTHRKFRIRADGSHRDVSFYSVIDREWPAMKERLTDRMRDRL